MKLYCPSCYEMNEWGSRSCARCGAPLRGPEGETYARRLIWALRHPEPSTALRAAVLLGKLATPEAIEPLTEVLCAPGPDPYVKAAAARSLGRIGGGKARAALVRTLEHGPVPARLAAVEALEALGPDESAAGALRRAWEKDGSSRVRRMARETLDGWQVRA